MASEHGHGGRDRRRDGGITTGIAIAIGMLLVVGLLLLVVLVGGVFFLRGSSMDQGVDVAEGIVVESALDSGPRLNDLTTAAAGPGEANPVLGIVSNDGNEPAAIVGVRSPVCGVMYFDNEAVPTVAPGSSLFLEDLGLMCDELAEELTPGEQHPITFEFEPQGELESEFLVAG